MAAWCWANSIKHNTKYTLIHIDKHYDLLGSQIQEWTKPINGTLKDLSLDEYDKIEYQHSKYERYKVFRWDNYIPIFHYYFGKQINEYVFYTHKRGDFLKEMESVITECPIYNLFSDFYLVYCKLKENLIINLDIDFFFCPELKSESNEYYLLFSEYSIEKFVKEIFTLINKNKNNILTIAMSPECCGGWENSLEFINKYFKKYGISIS